MSDDNEYHYHCYTHDIFCDCTDRADTLIRRVIDTITTLLSLLYKCKKLLNDCTDIQRAHKPY